MERLRLLYENHVAGVAQDDLPRSFDARYQLLGTKRAADEIVATRDHQGRRLDISEPTP